MNYRSIIRSAALTLLPLTSAAGSLYQPPGANLTYGDVTHGQRVQSASSNPAAAAADYARKQGENVRGTVVSGAAGLEYGNVQDIFDFLDEIADGYEPSPPDTGEIPPGQNPEDKPDIGIVLDEIWNSLDPDVQAAVDAAATEIVSQAAILALIRAEGYGKAWISADAPVVVGNQAWGGTWTFGIGWSGASKAFGITEDIEFDADEALRRLEDVFFGPGIDENLTEVALSRDVLMKIDEVTGDLGVTILNDSSIITKASQMSELSVGYSRPAWSGESSQLFIGGELKMYNMRLSRVSVRFGDITDSEELFNAIRDSEFNNDVRVGLDLGALWAGRNWQLGMQVTNINEPTFKFPDVDVSTYTSPRILNFLDDDQSYTMDSQVKVEGSVMTEDRRWSAHIGLDVDPATDPLGDQYQWATFSAGYLTDSWWIPSIRAGFRKNLTGTEMGYIGFGATLFKYVNLDISSALDTVSINGRDLPQGLMGSIGFQINW